MSPSKITVSLTEGPVSGHLYRMAMPMVWSILLMMSFNVIDTWFVSRLGVAELAAMSFTFPVVMTVSSLAIGLGAGVSSVVARAQGSGNTDKVRQLVTDGSILATLLGVTITVIGLIINRPLFHALGASDETMPLILDYMVIWFIGAPLVIAPMVALSSLRALGNSMITAKIMAIGSIVNIVLDPILIFGLLGAPRLELQGAALATVAARLLTFVAGFYYLKKAGVLAPPTLNFSRMWASWKGILHVGLPAVATNMIIPIAGGVVVALVAQHGREAVAGLGVAMRIEPIALIVFYALSSVAGPFFGQNASAGKVHRLHETLNILTRFCILLGLGLAVALFFGGRYLASFFSTEEQVLYVASAYLAVVPLSYAGYGLLMSINAAFNGLGKPLPATALSFLRVMGLYLPMALVANHFYGIPGLFAATFFCNLVMGLLGWWWLRRTIQAVPE